MSKTRPAWPARAAQAVELAEADRCLGQTACSSLWRAGWSTAEQPGVRHRSAPMPLAT